MEEGAKIGDSIHVPRQRVITTGYEGQKFIREMVTILQQNVVLVGHVLCAQTRYETVEYFELGHLEDTLLWLSLVHHRHRVFEHERTILAWSVHIDA